MPAASASAPPAPAPSNDAAAVPALPPTPPDFTSDGELYVLTRGGLQLALHQHDGRRMRLSFGEQALLQPFPAPSVYSHQEWTAGPEDGGLAAYRLAGDVRILYRLDPERRCVEMTHRLTNTDWAPQRHAALDVRRVIEPAALTFFPGKLRKPTAGATLPLVARGPIVWLVHDQNRAPAPTQATADTQGGWIATIVGSTIWIAAFSDTRDGSVDLRSDYDPEMKRHPWLEIAQRGPKTELPHHGDRVITTVRWFLRSVPPELSLKLGNPELVGFVKGIIQ